jgi:EpsI family protein
MATRTAITRTTLPGIDARIHDSDRAIAPISPAGWAGLAASLGLLGVLFASNLRHFVVMWQSDDNYSHGFLVPFISLYFAREAARRGPLPARSGIVYGLGLLALSILGKLTTIVVPVGFIGDTSFLIGLAGICVVAAGLGALRRFGFAIFFLTFMIPLPVAFYSMIASPLQMLVSQIAAALMNFGGIPVYRQGNMLTLPGDVRMFVAEACSGMRQLTGFFALTTAVAFLGRRPAWYRAVLVASSIPVAMTANVVRVILTGVIMYKIDPKYASGSFHTAEGLLMMGFGLGLLWAECAVLNSLASGRRDESAQPAAEPLSPFVLPRIATASLVGLFVLLTAGITAQAAMERALALPRPALKQPLATIPMRLGNWVGRDQVVEKDIIERSQADEYMSRIYEDPSHPGRMLSLWINYSKHGLNLRHSPEICLPSGGWTKVESQCRVLQVDRPGERPLAMTRLGYSQGELVQGIGFWYYIFGEGSVERYVRRLPITSRSSHGRTTRGSGLTVEVFCPGEFDPDGEALRDFARSLLSALEPILPDNRAEYFVP